MEEKTKENNEEEEEVPLISELPCWNCGNGLHKIIGLLNLNGKILFQCQSCGTINSLKLIVNDEPIKPEPIQKRKEAIVIPDDNHSRTIS